MTEESTDLATSKGMSRPPEGTVRVLLLEDTDTHAEAIMAVLRGRFVVTRATQLCEGLRLQAEIEPDVILLDLNLPDSGGLDTFEAMHAQAGDAAIVILTVIGDEDIALRAVREGAQDFLFKIPADLAVLPRAIRYAMERARIPRELRALAQERGAAAEDLERANTLLQDLVAIAAHEMASPITAILGFADVALQDGGLSGGTRESLEVVRRQAERLGRLVSDLMTTSKIQVHTLQPQPGIVDVALAARNALQELGREPDCVVIKCPDGLRAWADPDHVQRILVNYLGNAFKYGAPPVVFEASTRGESVEVRVRDAGPGIPAAFEPKLFQRFSRAGRSESPGNGLGLFIVRGLAIANGGDAWNEQQGIGACFAARLPALQTL